MTNDGAADATERSDADLADVIPIGIGHGTIGRTVTRTIDELSGIATAGVRAANRRLTEEPRGATDDWGRDPVLVRNMMLLAQLRWDVTTGGDQYLPKRKGALLVVNSPRFVLAPIFAAFAVSEAVDRPVRFVGRPDDDLFGALSRRVGGLLDDPDEVAGALRADEVVVLGAAPTRNLGKVGAVDHTIVGAAIATGIRVFPAATASNPFGRRARVEIGPDVEAPRSRRGPLAELELADRVRSEIRELLSSMGDVDLLNPGIGA